MPILEKYSITAKPPKIAKKKEKADAMVKVHTKFLAGLKKQRAKAKAWKPGAKDLRSWVTRDVDANRAWVTVKYGARPVPLKGQKSTIGPVPLDKLDKLFTDIKTAHAAGELDAGLQKVATLGPRKK
jgi:hypothetical protein